MEKNEIKKDIYKQKPKADFKFLRKGVMHYTSFLNYKEEEGYYTAVPLRFEIPVEDMGEADFYPEMEAKLLIRWLE